VGNLRKELKGGTFNWLSYGNIMYIKK